MNMLRARAMMVVAASVAAFTSGRADADEVAVGRYEGTAYNTTARKEGRAILDIVTIRSGKVYVHFQASHGLSGEGWLSGPAAGATFTVTGPLSGWTMTLHARVQPDGRLSGDYDLSGPGKQAGRIDVARTGRASAIVADGEPPLTEDMVGRYLDFYDGLLGLRLGADGRRELTHVLAAAWRRDDREVIKGVLRDLVNTGGRSLDEIRVQLGAEPDVTIIEAARRNSGRNAMEAALVAAFDRAHPDRVAATRAWGFADLVGKWHGGDALAAPSGALYGVSFSEAGILEIRPDHKFERAYFREHCQGGSLRRCCSQHRLGWRGILDLEDGRLAFHLAGGLELMSDSCAAGPPVSHDIPAHVERLRWWIRPRAQGTPALCWEDRPEHFACYVKQ
jgi:hypothetical protein